VVGVTTIGLRELRQNASEYVRRAEAGETIMVTVSGRDAAALVPAPRRTWRRWADIAPALRRLGTDEDWEHDTELIDQGVADPWADRG
jgi:prevent-host-death family protein